jgi:hypothetical protein
MGFIKEPFKPNCLFLRHHLAHSTILPKYSNATRPQMTIYHLTCRAERPGSNLIHQLLFLPERIKSSGVQGSGNTSNKAPHCIPPKAGKHANEYTKGENYPQHFTSQIIGHKVVSPPHVSTCCNSALTSALLKLGRRFSMVGETAHRDSHPTFSRENLQDSQTRYSLTKKMGQLCHLGVLAISLAPHSE